MRLACLVYIVTSTDRSFLVALNRLDMHAAMGLVIAYLQADRAFGYIVLQHSQIYSQQLHSSFAPTAFILLAYFLFILLQY